MSRCGLLAALVPFAAFAASTEVTSHYTETAKRLTDAALADQHSLDRLEYLCDRIGNRLSGSAALDRAVAFSVEEMKRAGLTNVRTQPVQVPHWVRGSESAVMIAPLERKLPILGLGNSVGTAAGGITADVVVVSTFEQLNAIPAGQLHGKIVLYDAPFQGYGHTVQYRILGASRAAVLGASAVLVRSITPFSLRTPHTGTLVYSQGVPQIPAAAITVEDAEAIHRLTDQGVRVTVQLKMEAHFDPDAPSANVIGEIAGREKPDEVVVAGGHLDSWDVGQGAQDDGSGIMAALEAARLIQRLALKPRRTIRIVFWVNEENGGAGGRAYKDALSEQALRNHVAAIEMDGGAEKPIGFGLGESGHPRMPGFAETAPHSGPPSKAIEALRQIGVLLTPIGANQIQNNGGGSDIEPLMAAGIPGIGELSTGAHYFDWHHTEADTFDKINPQDFRESVAAMSVMMYVLADMPDRLSDLQ